jgi:Domain of unknown function (DUF4440)
MAHVAEPREETMSFTRRDLGYLAFAGAVTLASSGFFLNRASSAETGDQASVDQAVEALRKAMLEADKSKLQDLTADQLSYGHSGGLVQNKADFINVIVDKKTVYKSIAYAEPSTMIAGNDAIVRHGESVESESNGKANSSKIGVLQVWQKQGGNWRLLARQGFKTQPSA